METKNPATVTPDGSAVSTAAAKSAETVSSSDETDRSFKDIIPIILAIVLAVVFLGVATGPSVYDWYYNTHLPIRAAKSFYTALEKGNTNKLFSVVPDEMVSDICEWYDLSQDALEDKVAVLLEEDKATIDEACSACESYKISYTASQIAFDGNSEVGADDEKSVTLTFEFTYLDETEDENGEITTIEKESKEEAQIDLFKINNKWYSYDAYNYIEAVAAGLY